MPNKPRAFFDSNVISSGLYQIDGTPGVLLRFADQGRFTLLVSEQVLAEVNRTVHQKMPRAITACRAFRASDAYAQVLDPTHAQLAIWLRRQSTLMQIFLSQET